MSNDFNRLELADISHAIIASGNSEWYENVATPLARSIEEVIPQHVGNIPQALRQRTTRGAVNGITAYAVIGVTLFFSQKIGEDFYDVVLRPRIRKCFEWLDGKLLAGNRETMKVFILNTWHQEYNIVVGVSVLGKNFAEIIGQLHLVGVVNSNALNWIDEHGVSGPVHYYKIEHGKVNAEPEFLERAD